MKPLLPSTDLAEAAGAHARSLRRTWKYRLAAAKLPKHITASTHAAPPFTVHTYSGYLASREEGRKQIYHTKGGTVRMQSCTRGNI